MSPKQFIYDVSTVSKSKGILFLCKCQLFYLVSLEHQSTQVKLLAIHKNFANGIKLQRGQQKKPKPKTKLFNASLGHAHFYAHRSRHCTLAFADFLQHFSFLANLTVIKFKLNSNNQQQHEFRKNKNQALEELAF